MPSANAALVIWMKNKNKKIWKSQWKFCLSLLVVEFSRQKTNSRFELEWRSERIEELAFVITWAFYLKRIKFNCAFFVRFSSKYHQMNWNKLKHFSSKPSGI